jgi:hypothetical protein
MLQSAAELLGVLCLSALTLLVGFSIVGSIIAALRAVGPESGFVNANSKEDIRFRG